MTWRPTDGLRPARRADGWPTRSDVQYWSPAEAAIAEAVRVVEEAGGSEALTDAVKMLSSARARVADHYEGVDATDAPRAQAPSAGDEYKSRSVWIDRREVRVTRVTTALPRVESPEGGTVVCEHYILGASRREVVDRLKGEIRELVSKGNLGDKLVLFLRGLTEEHLLAEPFCLDPCIREAWAVRDLIAAPHYSLLVGLAAYSSSVSVIAHTGTSVECMSRAAERPCDVA